MVQLQIKNTCEYKLLELDNVQLNKKLTLVGQMNSHAVITTPSETFVLKQQSISNTLLLVSPASSSSSSDNERDMAQPCSQIESAIYVLEPVKPDFTKLRLPLYDMNGNQESRVTLNDIRISCQSSEMEVTKYLKSINAFLCNGAVYKMPYQTIFDYLSRFILEVRANCDSFENIDLTQLANELQVEFGSDQDIMILKYVMDLFRCEDEFDSATTSGNDMLIDYRNQVELNGLISVDMEKIVGFLGKYTVSVVMNSTYMNEKQFIQKWQTVVDETFGQDAFQVTPDHLDNHLSYLECILTDAGKVELILQEKLPYSPQERLKWLFGKKSKWPVETIKKYLASVSTTPDKLILKYTKSFQDNGIRMCSMSKSLAY